MTVTRTLKPGARIFAEELRQATLEADQWAKRRDELIFRCLALGWKQREVAEMTGVTENAISMRVKRAREAE